MMRDISNQNETTIIRGVRGFDWSNRETPRKYIKNAFTRGKTFTGRDTLKSRIFCVFAKNKKTLKRRFFILSAGIPVKKRKTRKTTYVATLLRSSLKFGQEKQNRSRTENSNNFSIEESGCQTQKRQRKGFVGGRRSRVTGTYGVTDV